MVVFKFALKSMTTCKARRIRETCFMAVRPLKAGPQACFAKSETIRIAPTSLRHVPTLWETFGVPVDCLIKSQVCGTGERANVEDVDYS